MKTNLDNRRYCTDTFSSLNLHLSLHSNTLFYVILEVAVANETVSHISLQTESLLNIYLLRNHNYHI
jgi:hypothetical protein